MIERHSHEEWMGDKLVAVDTNVLVNALNADAVDQARAARVVEDLVNGSEHWALSWTVIYEFLRVVTHPRVFARPLSVAEAYSFIQELADSPTCTVITESSHHSQQLRESIEDIPRLAGTILHDFHIAVLMREHGITDLFTFDTDFRAFSWVNTRQLEQDR